MLTRIQIRNFKKLEDVAIDIGNPVVLVGPNNSGKTTALQAMALWEIGMRRWLERRQGRDAAEKRPGIAVNRRDLISIPVPSANLLWRDLHVRTVEKANGKQETKNIRIEIVVDGISKGKAWTCGLEFDYANEESFYCRPLRLAGSDRRMPVPAEAAETRFAFLPPMSGLAALEPKLEPGRINVLVGEGQTAQVLRNLCYQIYAKEGPPSAEWRALSEKIKVLFGVELVAPEYLSERGEIVMSYKEPSGIRLDLSAAGRGLQQTLLLLSHLYANPGTVLLLDEPDAHLEILRQRQVFSLLTEVSVTRNSQIIAASHSEVVLNEAAATGTVIAFVGRPHRLNDKGSQLRKSLSDIGWEHFYQAEQAGWVLYVEDSTDFAILRAFAKKLGHPALDALERPFIVYVSTNVPQKARDHFFGLREAKPDLRGLAIFDRLDRELHRDSPLRELMWARREIENYFCTEETLLSYARSGIAEDLFGAVEREKRVEAMKESIDEIASAIKLIRGDISPWSSDVKASDEFLEPVFRRYFNKLGLRIEMKKSDYYRLVDALPNSDVDREVVEKLDAILTVSRES